MYRFVALLAILSVTWFTPVVKADDDKPRTNEERRTDQLRRLLTWEVTFGPIDDPKMTVKELLHILAERYDVRIGVNEGAFREEKQPDILNSLPFAERPLDKLARVSFDTVLRAILARVPSSSGVTFLVRRDTLEITTVAAARAEIWGKDYAGPFLPLVQASFEKSPLETAFRSLSENAGHNIVLDGRAGDKAKLPVTATLTNVPLDTAVRLLADMADLKAVMVDNVLYVTSKDNARLLQEEEQKRKLGTPDRKQAEQGRSQEPQPKKTDRKPPR